MIWAKLEIELSDDTKTTRPQNGDPHDLSPQEVDRMVQLAIKSGIDAKSAEFFRGVFNGEVKNEEAVKFLAALLIGESSRRSILETKLKAVYQGLSSTDFAAIQLSIALQNHDKMKAEEILESISKMYESVREVVGVEDDE